MNDPAVNFWPALWNSIFSSTVIAASVVVFSTLAGWAFAKLRFRGSKGLLIFVVATMAVPTQLGVVPLYILFADLGWTGQIGAIIIPALTSAFGVFWMTQYLQQTVPDELIEAARVDGASMLRTFWTVGVVAARPAAAMLFLFTFVGAWNNFFWPFIVLDRAEPDAAGRAVAAAVQLLRRLLDRARRRAARDDPAAHPVRLRRQAARERHHGRRGQGLGRHDMTTETREDSARMTATPRAHSRRTSSSEPPPPPSRSKAPHTRTDAATRSGTRSAAFPEPSSTPTTAMSRATTTTAIATTSRS